MDIAIILLLTSLIGSKLSKKSDFRIKQNYIVSITFFLIAAIVLIIAYLIYTLPSQPFVISKGIPLIPLLISILTLSCAIYLFRRRHLIVIEAPVSAKDIPLYCWGLFAAFILLIEISKYGFLVSIYSPHVFKSDVQIPHVGIGIFLIGYFLSAPIIYIFSHLSFKKASNSQFWLLYGMTIFSLYQTTLYSLLLVFGLIQKFNVSYPFLASLMVFGLVPFISVLMIMTLKNHMVQRQEDTL